MNIAALLIALFLGPPNCAPSIQGKWTEPSHS